MHSRPYDIKTGTINASSFPDTVAYNYSRKREFYLVSLFMPEYTSGGKPVPIEELENFFVRTA